MLYLPDRRIMEKSETQKINVSVPLLNSLLTHLEVYKNIYSNTVSTLIVILTLFPCCVKVLKYTGNDAPA